MTLQKIPGFESTAYAYQAGRIVWAGAGGRTDHPRNAHAPWHPAAPAPALDANRLQIGAATCLALFSPAAAQPLEAVGLMRWLIGQPLAFPLNHATQRFDAVRDALLQHDLAAFAPAAIRLLGLGNGLTPSGDDFVGGILFTLVHVQPGKAAQAWLRQLPRVKRQIGTAAQSATNVISAALLDDSMAGSSYRVLHELLAAFNTPCADGRLAASIEPAGEPAIATAIESATLNLLALGASSGSDLLAGVLLAIGTLPTAH